MTQQHGHDGAGPLTPRCPNCGAVLVGPWCHACGQAGHPHRSLGAIGHDLLHGVLHFEGKVWRTLPMLIARPGELTRRYIHGERQYFVSPFAMFLFAVFLSFAVLGLTGRSGSDANESEAPGGPVIAASDRFYDEMQASLSDIDRRIALARRDGVPTAELEQERRDVFSGARTLGYTDAAGVALVRPEGNHSPLAGIDLGSETINAAIRKLGKNPSLIAYKVQSYAYKFAWALIPLSVPFLWMLYAPDRRYGAYDHYVFVTYSLTFVLLLFVFVRLLMATGLAAEGTAVLAMALVPVHMYRQLRGAYRGGRASSLVRTALLVLFSATVTVLFATMLLTAGLLA